MNSIFRCGIPALSMVLIGATGWVPAGSDRTIPIEVSVGGVIVTVEPIEAEVSQGDSLQLKAVVTDPDGSPLDRRVTWASSNPVLATVGTNGVVTGHFADEVEIVAHVGNARGSAMVRVRAFDPDCVMSSSEGWDLELARELSIWATLAYPSSLTFDNKVIKTLKSSGCWELVRTIGPTQLHVVRNTQTSDVLVTFEGTQDLSDAIDDVNAVPTAWTNGPTGSYEVHTGFLNAYRRVQAELREVLFETVGKIEDRASARVYFTGHSMGGSLATLAAMDAVTALVEDFQIKRNNVVMYAIAPARAIRTGPAYTLLVPNSFAIASHDDLAPHLVPMSLLSYRHIPNIVVLNSRQLSLTGPFQPTRLEFGNGSAFKGCANLNRPGDPRDAHDSKLYTIRLENVRGSDDRHGFLTVTAGFMTLDWRASNPGICDWVGLFKGDNAPTDPAAVLGVAWRWVDGLGIAAGTKYPKGVKYWAAYVDGFGNIVSTQRYVPQTPRMTISRTGLLKRNIYVTWKVADPGLTDFVALYKKDPRLGASAFVTGTAKPVALGKWTYPQRPAPHYAAYITQEGADKSTRRVLKLVAVGSS